MIARVHYDDETLGQLLLDELRGGPTGDHTACGSVRAMPGPSGNDHARRSDVGGSGRAIAVRPA